MVMSAEVVLWVCYSLCIMAHLEDDLCNVILNIERNGVRHCGD